MNSELRGIKLYCLNIQILYRVKAVNGACCGQQLSSIKCLVVPRKGAKTPDILGRINMILAQFYVF